MGLSSSKHNAGEASTSSSSAGHRRRVFQSSCFRVDDCDDDTQVADQHSVKSCSDHSNVNQIILVSDHVKSECCAQVEADKHIVTARKSSNSEIDDWDQSNHPDSDSRAPILGLSRASCGSSRSLTALNEEENNELRKSPFHGSVSRSKSSRGRDFLPSCFLNRFRSPQYENRALENFDSNSTASKFSYNSRDNHIVSTGNVLNNGNNHTDRRIGAREPVERNIRFSRTLSVGRLRDRVVQRSSFSDLTFSPVQQDREVREASGGVREGVLASDTSALFLPNSSGIRVDTSRARESRYHDLLENQSNFLERRRRIGSQVCALQRLGSRFENLLGHERPCFISGQHQTGHCACHITPRDSSLNDDTRSRQNISRIVMLAEALFGVLDEIHQQSVVLSSQPSVSSIGSVPAPNDVVESLPVKLYSKPQKQLTEEAAQCYICLVDYEEGDFMRTLPCHHEFHSSCVD